LLHHFLDQVFAAYSHQKYIAEGNLDHVIERNNVLAMPLKALQANLRHLVWQVNRIAGGDYNQTVHCLGGFSAAFNTMTEKLKDRAQLQEEKLHLQAQLHQAQKMESISRLAAGMAHEINTPAHFITINLEFIQEAFNDIFSTLEAMRPLFADDQAMANNEPLRQLAQSLESIDWEYIVDEVPKALSQSLGGIARVASIIASLKELAQPAAPGSSRADLNALILETVEISANEWNRVAEITAETDEALSPVTGLERELRQVLFNLIVNGAQAVEEKIRRQGSTDKGLVEVRSHLAGSMARITVRDSGIGISPENMAKLFDPFFSTKEVGQGTGQGLTIAYDIVVNKHGGTIEVDSSVDQGTTITVTLPLLKTRS
jgi:signal transduction histidine kinase